MNKRHQLFADKYVECWNATEAYKYVYPKAKDTTAASNGYQLLRNTEIAEYIQQKVDAIMPAGEVLKRLADEAKGDNAQNKIKALELLGKKHKLFTERIEGNLNHSISWASFIGSEDTDTEPNK